MLCCAPANRPAAEPLYRSAVANLKLAVNLKTGNPRCTLGKACPLYARPGALGCGKPLCRDEELTLPIRLDA